MANISQQPGPIEAVNPDSDDTDSTLGNDVASSTASLASSILNYKFENGRSYHAYSQGAYPIPNDETEQERLDFQHHIYLMLLGGELSPINFGPEAFGPLENVLDIGTGTGIWAIEFADQFPNAQITATDLSAIQPGWVPPNLQFQIDDCEQEWTFKQNFDYIHARSMGGSIADWPRLLKKAYDSLRPGGWIEITEFDAWMSTDDDSLPKDSSIWEWINKLDEGATMFGKTMNIAKQFKSLVKEAGFESVEETQFKAPLSPWPKDKRLKELSLYMQQSMLDSLEPYSMALFTRVLGWTPERLQVLLDGVRKDLHNLRYHIYSVAHFVYARKPGTPSRIADDL